MDRSANVATAATQRVRDLCKRLQTKAAVAGDTRMPLDDALRQFSKTSRPKVEAERSPGGCVRVVTWNVWFNNLRWEERLAAVLTESFSQSPDVLCFQEVTAAAHCAMLNCTTLCEKFKHTETTLPSPYDVAIWVRRSSDISLCWTKTISVFSTLGRRGLYADLHFQQPDTTKITVRVCTAHLESMRENRSARERQLKAIIAELRSAPWPSGRQGATILVGDFNFDASSAENMIIDLDAEATDVWGCLRPEEPGFTEDTTINLMRLKAEKKHKQVRFDRVVLLGPGGAKPVAVKMLGTERIDDELWPSDHFGLAAEVSIN